MRILDLEQLEILSDYAPVLGGSTSSIFSLNITDDLISFSLDDQQFLSENLSRCEPLNSAFSLGEFSGLLTATCEEDHNQLSRVITLTGSDDTSQFAFTFTSTGNF